MYRFPLGREVFDIRSGLFGVVSQSFVSGTIIDFGPSSISSTGRRKVQFSPDASLRDLLAPEAIDWQEPFLLPCKFQSRKWIKGQAANDGDIQEIDATEAFLSLTAGEMNIVVDEVAKSSQARDWSLWSVPAADQDIFPLSQALGLPASSGAGYLYIDPWYLRKFLDFVKAPPDSITQTDADRMLETYQKITSTKLPAVMQFEVTAKRTDGDLTVYDCSIRYNRVRETWFEVVSDRGFLAQPPQKIVERLVEVRWIAVSILRQAFKENAQIWVNDRKIAFDSLDNELRAYVHRLTRT